MEFGYFSVAVKKNVWRHGLFVHVVLLKLFLVYEDFILEYYPGR